MAQLIITADDYGYSPRYDAGILEAAAAGAIDAVGAMVTRPDAAWGPLLASGVEVGLHLVLGWDGGDPRAGEAERALAAGLAEEQIGRFRELLGRPPAYLDGHHHAHAREGVGIVICDLAKRHGLPVRSVGPRHRRLLRCRGVATPDLLIGRSNEREPVIPPELEGPLPAVVEWMVHPGYPDPGAGSDYDAGRLEDLRALLTWTPPRGIERATHGEGLRR